MCPSLPIRKAHPYKLNCACSNTQIRTDSGFFSSMTPPRQTSTGIRMYSGCSMVSMEMSWGNNDVLVCSKSQASETFTNHALENEISVASSIISTVCKYDDRVYNSIGRVSWWVWLEEDLDCPHELLVSAARV